jgi:hypothetical protein
MITPLLVMFMLLACEREPIVSNGPDTIPPIPPAGLFVELARDGFITINWARNNERDVVAYIVYRSASLPEGPFTALDTSAASFYVDEHGNYDIRYYYHVTALDDAGNESPPSNTISSDSPNLNDPQTPDKPTLVSIQTQGESLLMRLSWARKDDSDLAGYNIYRATELPFDADSLSQIATTSVLFFDDTTATSIGKRYYYKVRAVDKGGRRSIATETVDEIHLPVPLLLEPDNLATVIGTPVFKWAPVTDAMQYEVQVLETPDDALALTILRVNQSPENLSARYFGPLLQPGRLYYWRVVSFSVPLGYPNSRSETRTFMKSP